MTLSKLGLTQHLNDLLEGRVTPDNADPRILNWAEFMIHKRACQVISLPTKEDRRKDLNTIPETIRPYVERECKKVWTYRHDHSKT